MITNGEDGGVDSQYRRGILGEVQPGDVEAIVVNWVDHLLAVREVRESPGENGVYFEGTTSDDQPMGRLVRYGETFSYVPKYSGERTLDP
ncbi:MULTISPECIES: hypothetical protein [unclassified Dietzia]|uniref:hypothetical protein n=1 Tax=unclassified Dietzia TaxID=2617939 RepID=UPI0015FCFDDD|nr:MULTISPECIES: hypothetical protein [unclassified Dietzia]MBB1024918.1 hypothetical protein [Dietzia sp. DQ12-76]MBB1029040.1 hypothetical protein [Dietzia sp. DQ11-38-2]